MCYLLHIVVAVAFISATIPPCSAAVAGIKEKEVIHFFLMLWLVVLSYLNYDTSMLVLRVVVGTKKNIESHISLQTVRHILHSTLQYT